MSSDAVAALVGANPGPAAHLALLGAVAVIGLVIFAGTRWRRRREGQSEHDPTSHDFAAGSEHRARRTDREHGHDRTHR
jgi:hypothetical protein